MVMERVRERCTTGKQTEEEQEQQEEEEEEEEKNEEEEGSTDGRRILEEDPHLPPVGGLLSSRHPTNPHPERTTRLESAKAQPRRTPPP